MDRDGRGSKQAKKEGRLVINGQRWAREQASKEGRKASNKWTEMGEGASNQRRKKEGGLVEKNRDGRWRRERKRDRRERRDFISPLAACHLALSSHLLPQHL